MATSKTEPLTSAQHETLARRLFNETWTLIDEPRRSPEQVDRMIHGAHASRLHWQKAGGDPKRLSVGEWQIARVYAVLGRPEPSQFHARRALEIAETNDLEPFYVAYGHEAVARAMLLRGDSAARDHLAEARALVEAIDDPEQRDAIEPDLAELARQLR